MNIKDEATGLYFEIKDKAAQVTDCDKRITAVTIPPVFNGAAVTAVGKKAFLGCKMLRSVELPDTVSRVGEWAFAGCDALSSVLLPQGEVIFGKGVFERDSALFEIKVKGKSPDSAYLMAKAVTVMEAEYMLDTVSCGSSEWLLSWDRKLENLLSLRDDEGYHLYVLCGEEDLHLDYDEFLEHTRRKKASLCLLRLLWDEGLSEPLREVLKGYVRDHSIGCKSEAAWDYVVREKGDDLTYFELLSDLGCVSEKNLERALPYLGDRFPQAKAYLINRFSAGGGNDFVDSLLL